MSTNNNNNRYKEEYNYVKKSLNTIFPSELEHVNLKSNHINNSIINGSSNGDGAQIRSIDDGNEIRNLDIEMDQANKSHGDKDDNFPAFVLLVVGFFVGITWIINLRYIKSTNSDAKVFSILSLIFLLISVALIIVLTLYEKE